MDKLYQYRRTNRLRRYRQPDYLTADQAREFIESLPGEGPTGEALNELLAEANNLFVGPNGCWRLQRLRRPMEAWECQVNEDWLEQQRDEARADRAAERFEAMEG